MVTKSQTHPESCSIDDASEEHKHVSLNVAQCDCGSNDFADLFAILAEEAGVTPDDVDFEFRYKCHDCNRTGSVVLDSDNPDGDEYTLTGCLVELFYPFGAQCSDCGNESFLKTQSRRRIPNKQKQFETMFECVGCGSSGRVHHDLRKTSRRSGNTLKGCLTLSD